MNYLNTTNGLTPQGLSCSFQDIFLNATVICDFVKKLDVSHGDLLATVLLMVSTSNHCQTYI